MKYPIFTKSCNSLLSKYLSPEIFDSLKELRTSNNYSLSAAINSGVKNEDSGIGVYAGDAESYTMFNTLFDPIIQDYHAFSGSDKHSSDLNLAGLNAPNPDPESKYILSTRIRVGRNLDNVPLGPAISDEQRNIVESNVVESLSHLTGELQGTYFPLLGMTKEVQEDLISSHFLFKEGDRFLQAAGLNNNWPHGRGIFHNDDKTFLVWVNEEDQLRIISMQQGGDIGAVFERLINAVQSIEKRIDFSFDERLGYITSCPTNLGTAMRASVHISLPKLSKEMDAFKAITDKHHLQIRGIHGEHTEDESGIFDISNRRRLGITEIRAVQDLYDGVIALIAKEESLT